MKKKILTKNDIQKELLNKVNKLKVIVIFLTILILLCIALYPFHLYNFINGTPLNYDGGLRSFPLSPKAAIIFIPILIIGLIIIVFFLYFINFIKIKKGKFRVIEDRAVQKKQEFVHYYRNMREENMLYFNYGRIAVEKEVYSGSKVGDSFYIVVLNNNKAVWLAYNKNDYEIQRT